MPDLAAGEYDAILVDETPFPAETEFDVRVRDAREELGSPASNN
jgi:hypothetical protein